MLTHQNELSLLDRDAENDSAAALASKVKFLSQPGSYKPPPKQVRSRETHMSWVFMNGDRVYKLKKPVKFPYLDFSTRERREAACRAEADLNRRLARDVYLGVLPLTKTVAGYAIGGPGRVIDWLVVMRKLDESETLESALHNRTTGLPQLQRLTGFLNEFYSRAPRISIDPETYVVGLCQGAATDWQVLLSSRFGLLQGTIDRIAAVQRRFLKTRSNLLKARIRQRHVVDAHGDLRPEHIWLTNPPVIIDCLEFNARLRALDALDETAFLHLECERLGGRWVGDFIRRQLATLLQDDPANGLFLFYRIGRAMLRARLSIAHLNDAAPRTPEKWPRLTRTYLELAQEDARHLDRVLSRAASPVRRRGDKHFASSQYQPVRAAPETKGLKEPSIDRGRRGE